MTVDGEALLQWCGISRSYWDIWGREHHLTAQTARALFEAFGFEPPSGSEFADPQRDDPHDAPHDPKDTLAVLRYARAVRSIPPVAMCFADELPSLEITVPHPLTDDVLEWQLRLEDGTIEHGRWAIGSGDEAGEHVGFIDVLGQRFEQRRLSLSRCLPMGYHQLSVQRQSGLSIECRLIVAPRACFIPPAVDQGRRTWGLSTQLYAIRSERNWGIGDLGDLLALIDIAHAEGASFVGVNPLHALYGYAPERCSPYSPSSRQWFNPIYLAVEAVVGFDESEAARCAVARKAFHAELARVRGSDLVDYVRVSALKHEILRLLFEHFRSRHLTSDTTLARSYRDFCASSGDSLHGFALFEAMSLHGMDARSCADGSVIRAFETSHAVEIDYQKFLQWQFEQQLSEIRQHAMLLEMDIGLYSDLAVGSDAGGADVWTHPARFALGVNLGAPPDDFALDGQAWGLAPWVPDALEQEGYEPFIECLRANMRHAGALRVDHVIGLMRQFWVPNGTRATDGAYVANHFEALLKVLALESHRNQCLVIGEDLGTVPPEARERFADFAVLSYRVFYFEKYWEGDHSFRLPTDYPENALACVSTHDLPTLRGYWVGNDLELRRQLDLFPSAEIQARLEAERVADRYRLVDRLRDQGVLAEGMADPNARDDGGVEPMAPALAEAVHRYVARSEAVLFSVQIEDLLNIAEQANLPGTVDEHDNWRRKLPILLEEWRDCPSYRAIIDAIHAER